MGAAADPPWSAEDRARLLKLGTVLRLIVRNIQIDTLLPPVVEQRRRRADRRSGACREVGSAATKNNAVPPSAEGVRGPGIPWSVARYCCTGGDAWHRARLLILMGGNSASRS